MSELNIPLLRKTVEWVEEQETLPIQLREWQQGSWFRQVTEEELKYEYGVELVANAPWCDTTMCFAGKIAWDAGWKPVWTSEHEAARCEKNGEIKDVSHVAAELLGIPHPEDWSDIELFDAGRSAATLRYLAEDLAGEAL